MEKRTFNPSIVLMAEREVIHSLWRVYHKIAIWSRKIVHTSSQSAARPILDVEEPQEIDKFLDALLGNFRAASVVNLQALTTFQHDPKESLHVTALLENSGIALVKTLKHT